MSSDDAMLIMARFVTGMELFEIHRVSRRDPAVADDIGGSIIHIDAGHQSSRVAILDAIVAPSVDERPDVAVRLTSGEVVSLSEVRSDPPTIPQLMALLGALSEQSRGHLISAVESEDYLKRRRRVAEQLEGSRPLACQVSPWRSEIMKLQLLVEQHEATMHSLRLDLAAAHAAAKESASAVALVLPAASGTVTAEKKSALDMRRIQEQLESTKLQLAQEQRKTEKLSAQLGELHAKRVEDGQRVLAARAEAKAIRAALGVPPESPLDHVVDLARSLAGR